MGRQSRFSRSDLTGAALRLIAAHGPAGVTVAGVAREAGAPTGSIYHRYRSREQLLAELWMDVVEGFQAVFADRLAAAGDIDGAVDTARVMTAWTREHPLEARLLLLHRRQDFVAGDWPAELVDRAAALEPQLGGALRGFARRAFARADGDALVRLRFALLDAPFAAVKPYVQAGKPPHRVVDDLVEATVRAVLAPLAAREQA